MVLYGNELRFFVSSVRKEVTSLFNAMQLRNTQYLNLDFVDKARIAYSSIILGRIDIFLDDFLIANKISGDSELVVNYYKDVHSHLSLINVFAISQSSVIDTESDHKIRAYPFRDYINFKTTENILKITEKLIRDLSIKLINDDIGVVKYNPEQRY